MKLEMQAPEPGHSINMSKTSVPSPNDIDSVVPVRKHRSRKQPSVTNVGTTDGSEVIPPERRPRKARKVKTAVDSEEGRCSDDHIFGSAPIAASGISSLLDEKSLRSSGGPVDMFRISTPPLSGEIGMYRITSHSSWLSSLEYTMTSEDGLSNLSGRRSPFSSVLRIFSDSATRNTKSASFMGQTVAVIEYESRISSFASKLGPCRKMTCRIFETEPTLRKNEAVRSGECLTGQDSLFMHENIKDPANPELCVFTSVEPEWNAEVGGYILSYDLNAQALASVKNFQLQNAYLEKVYMFSKCARRTYFAKSKLSPLISFALAVSSIHRKLCSQ